MSIWYTSKKKSPYLKICSFRRCLVCTITKEDCKIFPPLPYYLPQYISVWAPLAAQQKFTKYSTPVHLFLSMFWVTATMQAFNCLRLFFWIGRRSGSYNATGKNQMGLSPVTKEDRHLAFLCWSTCQAFCEYCNSSWCGCSETVLHIVGRQFQVANVRVHTV